MYQKKNSFLLFLCVFFLLSCASNFPTQEKQPKEEKLKKIKNITNPDDVDAEIETIKSEIYKECLTELARITGKPYDVLKKKIDEDRILIKDFLQQEHFGQKLHHDPNIPEHMYYDICNSLKEEKIIPKNIILEYIPNSNNNTLAASQDRYINKYWDFLSVQSKIKLYNTLESKKYQPFQQFVYKHEIYHIFLRHVLILETANSHTRDHKILNSIIEREADVHAITNNFHLAHQGIKHRCTHRHTKILDNKSHCENMEIIYALMKRKNQLLYKEVN